MNALVIFGLLAVLMLTGMPISISLGLTVLTFLFTMTQVPLESAALKLFTGIEKFEIMAIPFFILAGNFLTHGGVADDQFRLVDGLSVTGTAGSGLAGVICAPCSRRFPVPAPATVVAIGSIPAGDGQGRVPGNKFGAGVITTSPAPLRHPDSAVHRHGWCTRWHQHLGRRPVHGQRHPGLAGGDPRWRYHLGIAKKFNYPRQPKANWASVGTASASRSGVVADRCR